MRFAFHRGFLASFALSGSTAMAFVPAADRAADYAADLDELVARLRTTHPEFAERCPEATFLPAVAALRERLGALSDAAFALELGALVARLADGHSRVETEWSTAWQRTLPVRFRRFEDGLFVMAAAPEHAALVGQRVTRIGARAIEPLLAAARPHVSGDNDAMRDAFVPLALIGPHTYSAAVNLASDLERETHTLFVGQPTGAGANHCGDALRFVLPRTGVPVRCSTVRWQKSDPRDRRTAILPDVQVADRFADWRAGRDPVLDAALSVTPDDPVVRELAALAPISHWTRPSQRRRR